MIKIIIVGPSSLDKTKNDIHYEEFYSFTLLHKDVLHSHSFQSIHGKDFQTCYNFCYQHEGCQCWRHKLQQS